MHPIRYTTQLVLSALFRGFFVLFADLRIYGRHHVKNLERNGTGVIFASNHMSHIDAILGPISLPLHSHLMPMHFVGLESKYYKRFPIGKYFYGGWLFNFLGAFPAKKGIRDYAKSLETHEEIVRKKRSLHIFPEGQMTNNYRSGIAKGGIGYLAEVTGATIVPVAVVGIDNLNFWNFFTFGKRLRVEFGQPTTFDELYSELVAESKRISQVPENLPTGEPDFVLPQMPALENNPQRYKLIAQKIMDRVNALV